MDGAKLRTADPSFPIRHRHVDRSRLRGLQGRKERLSQIPMEAFDLALGLRPIGSAEPDGDAIVLGDVEEILVVAMLALTVSMPLDDDGLGIIAQNLPRHAAEEMPARAPRMRPASRCVRCR